MPIQVFDIVKLLTNSKNKITAIASDSGSVYVSCKDGKLMIFEISSDPLRFNEKANVSAFSGVKKGAIAMKSMEKWKLFFSLNDKGIAIHKWDDMRLIGFLPSSSGCSLMSFDDANNIVVGVYKRKLLVYVLKSGNDINTSLAKEILLSDTIVSIAFLNSLLFVGFKKEYCLVDLSQGRSIKDICDISKSTYMPFCVPIKQLDGTTVGATGEENDNKEQGEMLLANERKGLLYDFVGSPARGKGQHLEWQSDAIGGVYLCPYFLACTNTGIEVHNSWRYQRVQDIDISTPRMIIEAHFKKDSINGTLDGAVVCSQQSVIILAMQSLSQQIATLISDDYKMFDDALTLCNLFPIGKEQLRDYNKMHISRLKGLYLFSQGKYDQAITYLQRGSIPIRQVLSLYPFIIPDTLPTNITPYPPRLFASKFEENVAIEALMPLLNSRKQQLLLKLKQIQNGGAAVDMKEIDTNSQSYIRLTLEAEDSEESVTNDLQVIDSVVLLRAYIRINKQAIIPLLQGNNYCSLEESQKLLANAGLERELIVLYSYHHRHDLAISQILTPLKRPDISDNEKHHRCEDLIHYLQQLGSDYKQLIFECSEMFYRESKQYVLDLFVNYDPVDGGEPIDRCEILQHIRNLSEQDPSLTHVWEKNALPITYLRGLIWEQKDQTPFLHTTLIELYCESISKLQDSIKNMKSINESMEEKMRDDESGVEVEKALHSLRLLLAEEEDLLLRSKKELLEFLEVSDVYDGKSVLLSLEDNKFMEERAILLSKLGEHIKALDIIAHRIGNVNMAEAYCDKVYSSGKDKDIYFHLINTYLTKKEDSILNYDACIKNAIYIFTNHSNQVNAVEVLSLFPDDTPLDQIIDSLEVVMTQLDEDRRDVLMLYKLASIRRLEVGKQYVDMRNTMFENTSTTICPVCRRIIGDSVFVWHSDGSVLHAACANQLQ